MVKKNEKKKKFYLFFFLFKIQLLINFQNFIRIDNLITTSKITDQKTSFPILFYIKLFELMFFFINLIK